MPNEKNYINGIIIKEHKFDNGGKILKIGIKVKEFTENLKSCEKDKDFTEWVNVIIARRKTPSDKGMTHYMFEDEWKPEPRNEDEDLPF